MITTSSSPSPHISLIPSLTLSSIPSRLPPPVISSTLKRSPQQPSFGSLFHPSRQPVRPTFRHSTPFISIIQSFGALSVTISSAPLPLNKYFELVEGVDSPKILCALYSIPLTALEAAILLHQQHSCGDRKRRKTRENGGRLAAAYGKSTFAEVLCYTFYSL